MCVCRKNDETRDDGLYQVITICVCMLLVAKVVFVLYTSFCVCMVPICRRERERRRRRERGRGDKIDGRGFLVGMCMLGSLLVSICIIYNIYI